MIVSLLPVHSRYGADAPWASVLFADIKAKFAEFAKGTCSLCHGGCRTVYIIMWGCAKQLSWTLAAGPALTNQGAMAFDMGNALAHFGSGCSFIGGRCFCWVAESRHLSSVAWSWHAQSCQEILWVYAWKNVNQTTIVPRQPKLSFDCMSAGGESTRRTAQVSCVDRKATGVATRQNMCDALQSARVPQPPACLLHHVNVQARTDVVTAVRCQRGALQSTI